MEKALLYLLNKLREFNAGEYLGAYLSLSESYIPILQNNLELELPNMLAFMKKHKDMPQEISDIRDELKDAFWYVEKLYGFREKSKWHDLYYQIKTWLHYIDGYYPQEKNDQLIENRNTSLTNEDIDEIWDTTPSLIASKPLTTVDTATLIQETPSQDEIAGDGVHTSEQFKILRPFKEQALDKLYDLVIAEEVFSSSITKDTFFKCIDSANFKEIWNKEKTKRNQLRCVIRYLKDHYNSVWIDCAAKELGMPDKKNLTAFNRETIGGFENKVTDLLK